MPAGAKATLSTSRKSPTSSVRSMLSEGMRKGCTRKAMMKSAATITIMVERTVSRQLRQHEMNVMMPRGERGRSWGGSTQAGTLFDAGDTPGATDCSCNCWKATRAASCSARFLVVPVPCAVTEGR